MFRILIPANVAAMYEFIIPIFMFDIFDSEYTSELVFEFDEEAEKLQREQIFD